MKGGKSDRVEFIPSSKSTLESGAWYFAVKRDMNEDETKSSAAEQGGGWRTRPEAFL